MIIVKTVPALIYDAITDENVNDIDSLFLQNPEMLNIHTFMGGQTWLGYAAEDGKLVSVKKLIAMGADKNIGDEIYGSKPICSACSNGHAEVARYLTEQGSEVDVEASVRNPLFAAIVGRSPDCVRIILETGIDVTVRYNSDTMNDMDAVAFALMRGEAECAEIIARWHVNGDETLAKQALIEAHEIAVRNVHA